MEKNNRKVPSSNILREVNAWQIVPSAIGIFTFTLTARANLMFIQNPHLQARILCLWPCDALFLSWGQNILERLTIENTIISSTLILKPKCYQHLSKVLKNRIQWTIGLLPIMFPQLLLSSKHGPASDIFLSLKLKQVFQGIVLMLLLYWCMY